MKSDTIILSWKQPERRGGEILSYTLYKQYDRSVSTLTVPGTERHFTFKGKHSFLSMQIYQEPPPTSGRNIPLIFDLLLLLLMTECCGALGLEFAELYEFWIVAHTIIGEGARSKVVSARPIQDGNNILSQSDNTH